MSRAAVTGVPGFLGSALLPRLLERFDRVDCLVGPGRRDRAERERRTTLPPAARDRVTLHDVDLTAPDLALEPGALGDGPTELFHLAAVYDLGVARGPAEAVNVRGTERLCTRAERWPALERVHHVSTCYVSGRHDGTFGPEALEVGQRFNNAYEASKFRAERAVRRLSPVPVTVYRPAIVVGDSETGYAERWDGPYYLLRWLLGGGPLRPVPWVPGIRRAELNVVPRDHVVDGLARLSAHPETAGGTYHLSDPNPPTVAEALRLFADAAGVRTVPVPTTRGLARRALSLPGVGARTGIEPAVLDYLSHPTRYLPGRWPADLERSVPPLSAYVDRLVRFARDNPDPAPSLAPEWRWPEGDTGSAASGTDG